MITNIKDCLYDNKFYWNIEYNPNATIENALPNCTTLCYGAIIQDGHKPPVKTIKNASSWHTVLTNGWSYIPYDVDKLEVGDIIEWQKKCHVAVCSKIEENKKIISASWYTGEHGKSVYEGSFDTRYSFGSLQQLSDYMLLNYKTRYFHCWSIDDENKYVGGLPEYILKAPLYSVKRDTNKNQIEVLTYEQNVRNKDNEIVKKAEKGYFNILSTKQDDNYVWYEVNKGLYIAGVNGRVNYLPKNENDLQEQINCLKKENEILKDKLLQINKLSEV